MTWNSIFDSDSKRPCSEHPSFTLWHRLASQESFQLDEKESVLHKGVLFRIDPSKSAGPKERFLILTRDKLYFKNKESSRIGGFMLTRFVRFCVDSKDAQGQSPQQGLILRFVRNLKYCEFLIKSLEEVKAWIEALSLVMVELTSLIFITMFRAWEKDPSL